MFDHLGLFLSVDGTFPAALQTLLVRLVIIFCITSVCRGSRSFFFDSPPPQRPPLCVGLVQGAFDDGGIRTAHIAQLDTFKVKVARVGAEIAELLVDGFCDNTVIRRGEGVVFGQRLGKGFGGDDRVCCWKFLVELKARGERDETDR